MRKPRKLTRKELEERIKNLEPYREAYFCMTKGLLPKVVTSGDTSGDTSTVTVVGLERASGGVVVGMDGKDCYLQYVSDLITKWSHHSDPYFREIASKLVKLQAEAVKNRPARKADSS